MFQEIKVSLMILAGLLCLNRAFAEDSSSQTSTTPSTESQTVSDEGFQNMKSKLEKLRKEDPEQFQNVLLHFREKRHEQMQDMAEKDPEQFKRMNKKFEKRMERLKTENPELYGKLKAKKAEEHEKRMNWLKEKHPDLHEVLQKTPGDTFKDKMQNLKTSNPEMFAQLKKVREEAKTERKAKFQEKWNAMSPEEREAFLKEHPRAKKFLDAKKQGKEQGMGGNENPSSTGEPGLA